MRLLKISILSACLDITLIYTHLIIPGVHLVIYTNEIRILDVGSIEIMHSISVRTSVTLNLAPPPLAAYSRVNLLIKPVTIINGTLIMSMATEYNGIRERFQKTLYITHFRSAAGRDRDMHTKHNLHAFWSILKILNKPSVLFIRESTGITACIP